MSKLELVKLVTGNSNVPLAEAISKELENINIIETPLCTDEVGKFNDGEINVHLENDMRGRDIYVIQSTCRSDNNSVNDNLIELLLVMSALYKASAGRINVMIPYYGYARQDRKNKPRTPISASVVAQLIEAVVPMKDSFRVVTVDLHCGQIQGFFPRAITDNLSAQNEFVQYLTSKYDNNLIDNCMIVSPDAGGVSRAKHVADKLNIPKIATILKRRAEAGIVEEMELVGTVKGKDCIIIDDIIDTAGTLCKAASLLMNQGARSVGACATHGVFSGPAMDRINKSCLSYVCVTDSIPQTENMKHCEKLSVISLAPLLAEAIRRIHNHESLSALFRQDYKKEKN